MATAKELLGSLYAPRMSDAMGWSSPEGGNWIPLEQRDLNTQQEIYDQLYKAVAEGRLPVTDFNALLTTENLGIHPDEFRQLPPDVQAAARANPQQFIQTVLANRNPANRDLLSAGAEGGFSSYDTAKWIPGYGLQTDPRAYKQVNEDNGLGGLGALAGLALGAWNPLGWGMIGAGALGGGAAGFLSSGNIETGLKGAALGGIGGAITQGIGNLTSGYNPIVQKTLTGAGQGAFRSAIGGRNIFEGALRGGVSGGVNTGLSSGMTSAFGTGEGGAWDKLLGTSGKMLGSELSKSIFSGQPNQTSPTQRTATGGGNMAIGDMTLGNLAGGLAPFLEGYQGYRGLQRGNEAYDKALNLIQTPSPDQAKYRGMLSDLMTSPGKFYESPVYKNLAEQGRVALERSQSARGILGSGGAAGELQDLGMKQAAQYYFPLAQMAGNLSGISGDQAARALGAEGLINADISRNAREAGTLQSLMRGVGYEDPQTAMAKQLLGGGSQQGGMGGMTLSDIGKAAKDWFGGTSDTDTGYDFSSPVFTDNMSWDNLTSGPSAGTDFSAYQNEPIDYSEMAGSQSDYLKWLMG